MSERWWVGFIAFPGDTNMPWTVSDRGDEVARFRTQGEAQADADRRQREDEERPMSAEQRARRAALRRLREKDGGLRFDSFGCFGPDMPPATHKVKRYVARISFEDSSDVSDYYLDFHSLDDAAQEYRATAVFDLDSGDEWDVEWEQRAVRRSVAEKSSDVSR